MIVYFYATGYIRSHFTESKYEFQLDDNSTMADLFEEIDKAMGKELAEAIWNRDKKRFRGPVIIKIDGNIVKQENYSLTDGQTVEISRLLVGG